MPDLTPGEVRFNEAELLAPLRWKRPRMIFVCAHGDLFHESVPSWWLDRIFAVMALCPQHTFQVLTKRSARMREYFSAPMLRQQMRGDHVRQINRSGINPRKGCAPDAMLQPYPLPNVWLGVSVEDQQRADERIPDLLATPAAIRWLSAEPLLGPVDLCDISAAMPTGVEQWDALDRVEARQARDEGGCDGVIDWVVVGGESGSKARPMHPDWARSLRDKCAAAGVPFFFKQWGEWMPAGDHLSEDVPEYLRLRAGDRTHVFEGDHQQMVRVGKKRAGRLLDGVEHNGMPGGGNA